MEFNSLEFIAFLIPVFLVYYALTHRAQNLFLLGCSYFFYGFWDWRFLGLILASTTVDYLCARGMERGFNKRALLTTSIAVNLGILGVFKYFGFFMDNFTALFGDLGITFGKELTDIVLPVGISFYTFQTMGYTIDVYRGVTKAEKNFFDFALFVSFFPQLVAGPIERAEKLIKQIKVERLPTANAMHEGLWLILYGYFAKVVVADNMRPYVDKVFQTPGTVSGSEIPLILFMAVVMLYCDFSGYSKIARGTARLFGFELSVNFRFAFFARNPQDFWQRYHLTLSSWFRDYVYHPILKRTNIHAVALVGSFLLLGLWHGASWNFVLWGGASGLSVLAHQAIFRGKRPLPTPIAIFLHTVWTCGLVSLFFAQDLRVISRLAENITKLNLTGGEALLTCAMFVLPLFLLEWVMEQKGEFFLLKQKPWVWIALPTAMFLILLISGNTQSHEFIYFQF